MTSSNSCGFCKFWACLYIHCKSIGNCIQNVHPVSCVLSIVGDIMINVEDILLLVLWFSIVGDVMSTV